MKRTIAALAFALIALTSLWWVTEGSFRLFAPMAFGNVFEAQAQSFLAGRLDLDCRAASGEAFTRDSKCYVYFGPAPALLRIPFVLLHAAEGNLTRAAVLLANLLFLAVIVLMLAEAGYPLGSWPSTAYLLLAAFGSTIPYVLSWPTTYTEAISWGIAAGAASLYCLIRWTRERSTRWLTLACLAAILAFFSRVTAGAGPMLAVGIIALRERNKRTLLMLTAAAALFVLYNHARFGTWLNSVPVELHVQYNEARLRTVKGTLFHPEQAPPVLLEYLIHPPRFRASYPWLGFRHGFTARGIQRMDMMEVHIGALFLMPALLLLAIAGIATGPRWILLAPGVGLLLVASVAAINHRYVHEFVLLLLPAGVYGLRWALAAPWRIVLTAVLALWSCYANWATALVAQRELHHWISDEARDRHRTTRFVMDRWLAGNPDAPLDVDYLRDGPPPAVTGLEVRLRYPAGSRYRFDGERWQHVAGPVAHRFRVQLRVDKPEPRVYELLVAGAVPEFDSITIRPAPQGQYVACVDHYRFSMECGASFPLAAGRTYLFDCEFDRLNREVRILLDGKQVTLRKVGVAAWTEDAVRAVPPAQLAE